MPDALRDFLLSFCPARIRQAFPPESSLRTLHSATWGGLSQFFLAGLAVIIQLKAYFIYRSHQLAPQIGGMSDAVQAGATVVVLLEFFIHPLPALCTYLSIEGLVRFMAGLTAGEVLPSLPVVLAFKIKTFVEQRDRKKQDEPPVPDTLENCSDGCLRITSARDKANWNASITISVDGQWFEVERAEATGASPRIYVYCLRPAPLGKILRGYEEYDVASAVRIGTDEQPSAAAAVASQKNE